MKSSTYLFRIISQIVYCCSLDLLKIKIINIFLFSPWSLPTPMIHHTIIQTFIAYIYVRLDTGGSTRYCTGRGCLWLNLSVNVGRGGSNRRVDDVLGLRYIILILNIHIYIYIQFIIRT